MCRLWPPGDELELVGDQCVQGHIQEVQPRFLKLNQPLPKHIHYSPHPGTHSGGLKLLLSALTSSLNTTIYHLIQGHIQEF